mmetsp:Transcript_27469/g.65071  ORF Transcript_27469/g.65071 Transcript_27469/m.65071 type:complete len:102 (+) Transcript_27469:2949-3254(+)
MRDQASVRLQWQEPCMQAQAHHQQRLALVPHQEPERRTQHQNQGYTLARGTPQQGRQPGCHLLALNALKLFDLPVLLEFRQWQARGMQEGPSRMENGLHPC